MSIIHLNHLKGELERKVTQHIDQSDLDKFSEGDKLNIVLSRAFALYTIKTFTGESFIDISNCITDGFHDNGIDGLYWDKKNSYFYLIQSKWNKSAQGSPKTDDLHKFFQGVKQLLQFDLTGFNEKIKSKMNDINDAFMDHEVKLKLILCHTGNELSSECQKIIDKTVSDLNEADEVINFEEFNLKDAHRALTLGIEGSPINVEIDIYQWGKNDEPVKSVYGQISCQFFAQIFKDHKLRLFSQNIRGFMGESDINMEIVKSIVNEPQNFVYLNNGITILTKRLQKSAYGANERASGHFHCEDITIVNGAQTVGSIYEAFKKNPDQVSKAMVFARIISLENCPEDFDRKVTVATNTQNKIEKKDFVSLDPEQHRLKTELMLDSITYSYKRDDSPNRKDEKNLDLEDATVALACLNEDIDLSTFAKREISRLWDDTKRSPYRLIFNESLSATKLYKAVIILRIIEAHLKENVWGSTDFLHLIVVHGMYLINHLVFQEIEKELLNNPKREILEEDITLIKSQVSLQKDKVINAFQTLFNGKFPPTVFKNVQYVRSIKEFIYKEQGRIIPGKTLNLFPDE